jgi:Ni/Fe-hydrogenase subunit HybB-like protein
MATGLPPQPDAGSLDRSLPRLPSPYVPSGTNFQGINDQISTLVLRRTFSPFWLALLMFFGSLLTMYVALMIYLITYGVGIWGIDIPVAWGFAIALFVWWVGIAHAGTLISAILLLMHQKWRTSINRLVETMTIFSVLCAGMFPILHLGRPWFFWWLLPYQSDMGLWPQFRSALTWDVFAVSTYLLVSLLFWYIGMIPDLAMLRDRGKSWIAKFCYGLLALGWRNSAKHWFRFEMAYLILAGLATALIVSVSSVVSCDFAISLEPGWHETVFPPYFVSGAIYSGFAMGLVLVIPLRYAYNLYDFITQKHLDVMAKLLIVMSFITSYGYMSEQFMAWYGPDEPTRYQYYNRLIGFGQYGSVVWAVLFLNTILPQMFWIPRLRRKPLLLFTVSGLLLIGMWMERYMIIVTTLHRDFLPSSWGMFQPTAWDYVTMFGSIGLFATLILLFVRFLPLISMSEMRAILPGTHAQEEGR